MPLGLGDLLTVGGALLSGVGNKGTQPSQSLSGFAGAPAAAQEAMLGTLLPAALAEYSMPFQPLPMQRAANPADDIFASQALYDLQQYSDAMGSPFNPYGSPMPVSMEAASYNTNNPNNTSDDGSALATAGNIATGIGLLGKTKIGADIAAKIGSALGMGGGTVSGGSGAATLASGAGADVLAGGAGADALAGGGAAAGLAGLSAPAMMTGVGGLMMAPVLLGSLFGEDRPKPANNLGANNVDYDSLVEIDSPGMAHPGRIADPNARRSFEEMMKNNPMSLRWLQSAMGTDDALYYDPATDTFVTRPKQGLKYDRGMSLDSSGGFGGDYYNAGRTGAFTPTQQLSAQDLVQEVTNYTGTTRRQPSSERSRRQQFFLGGGA